MDKHGIFAQHSPFILSFAPADDTGTGGDGDKSGDNDKAGGGGSQTDNDAPKFPANTPVKDMTPEQQAAYHQHQSRKHEDRVKGYGDWTPEKIRALEKERDDLRTQGLSDAEKAIAAAKEEGRAEVRVELNRERATSAIQKALEGRVPDAGALLGLDLNKFIVDGKVDPAAVKAWVDDNSEEAVKGHQQKRHVDLGQGRRDQVTDTAGDRGRSEAARRFQNTKKKTD